MKQATAPRVVPPVMTTVQTHTVTPRGQAAALRTVSLGSPSLREPGGGGADRDAS